MQKMTLDYFDHGTVLKSVHPDVEHLVYDSDEPLQNWAELGRCFPNLLRLDIEELSRNGGAKQINAEFFSQFSQLQQLDIKDDVRVDFSGVDAQLLVQMQVMKLKLCSAENLEVLSELPKLSELQLTLDQADVQFSLGANSVVTSLSLSLGKEVRTVSCDLANSSVEKLSLGNIDYYVAMTEPLTFTSLSLPNSLLELEMAVDCPEGLPHRLLGQNKVMQRLVLHLKTPTLAEDLFGDLEEVDKLWFELSGKTAPLPNLFAKLKRADDLRLKFEDTPIPRALLPQGMQVQELTYSNSMYDDSEFNPLVEINLLRLPNLRRAYLYNIQADGLVWLEHSPELEYLQVSPVGTLAWFPKLPALKGLGFNHAKMEVLPENIRHNSAIERLSLFGIKNNLSRLGDMSQMLALSELWLKPWSNELEQLPDQNDILTLPALKELCVDIDLGQYDPVWVKLPASVKLKIDDDKLAKAHEIFKHSHLSDEESLDYLMQLASIHKPAELPSMPDNFHLVMMAAKHNRFKTQHKAWLSQLAKENQQSNPFGAGSTLFVAGRSGFKVSELKAKAEEVGFTLSKKLDNSVTHILLGTAPKDVQLIDLQRFSLIDDAILQQCFEAQAPKFLQQQGANPMQDSVLQMLASPDEASHRVAVEMLEQGGVTEAMRLPLFFILKTTKDNNFRKQIKHLLAGMGDEAFQLAVNDRILFHDCRGVDKYNRFKGQGVMVDKLKRQRKKWGETLCMDFAQLFFKRYGEGLVYVLMQKEPADHRLSILESLVEGDCLNWRKGMGMDQIQEFWGDKPMLDMHWNPDHYNNTDNLLGMAKTELPVELAQRHAICRLDLGNCLLKALPKGCEHFSAVTSLSLANNMLDKLPPFLAKFNQLQELDLSYNHFREFPKVLLKLSNLKRLDLRRATRVHPDVGYGKGYRQLQVPQAFLDANPGCEVLLDEA